jgi:hypothetical protein
MSKPRWGAALSFFIGVGVQFAPIPDSWRWGITFATRSVNGGAGLRCVTYFLDVAIVGDGVTAQTFALKFDWTGNWQTSWLTLPDRDSATRNRIPHETSRQPLRPIEIRDALADFIQRGEAIIGRQNTHNDVLTDSEIHKEALLWLTSVTEFVKDNMDVAHVDKLKDYRTTVERSDKYKLALNLCKAGLVQPTDWPALYELAFKRQVLIYFHDEIH